MNSANRRGFLKIAGAGAAAAGAATLTAAPASAARAGGPAVQAGGLPATASGSMVAYIDDVANGELSVMIQGREITVTDHDLVARLATAVHLASTAAV